MLNRELDESTGLLRQAVEIAGVYHASDDAIEMARFAMAKRIHAALAERDARIDELESENGQLRYVCRETMDAVGLKGDRVLLAPAVKRAVHRIAELEASLKEAVALGTKYADELSDAEERGAARAMSKIEELEARDKAWAKCLIGEDAETINRITARQIELRASCAKPDPKTHVRVRIAVSVLGDGRWTCDGGHDQTDEESGGLASNWMNDDGPDRVSFVEAWVPKPEKPATVEGEVSE